MCAIAVICGGTACGAELPVTPPAEAQQKIFIREIRVAGTQTLPRLEVEEAVYPFLGPGRTFTDVEGARAALEKAYHEKGYKATQVVIPERRKKRRGRALRSRMRMLRCVLSQTT